MIRDRLVTGTELMSVLRNPYYMRHGFCEHYANALLEAFNVMGKPAWRVDYEWRSADGEEGSHAVVMWRAGNQWWCMDSQEEAPVRVTGRSWTERCHSQDRRKLKVTVVQVGTRGWVT